MLWPMRQNLTTTRSTDLVPTKRELRWLAQIEYHGPQSSEFLFATTQDTHRCKDTALRRLQALREAGYLGLPPQQRYIAKADFNPYVYDLTPHGHATLQSTGAPLNPFRPTGHWWHRFWVSSVTSALSIEARQHNITFWSAPDILRAGQKDLSIPLGTGRRLIPDQLFALQYTKGFRLLALELDRGTEPLASTAARKSLRQMLAQYVSVQNAGLHRTPYGVSSPLLLLVTFAHPGRAAWFLKEASKLPQSNRQGILVQTLPPLFPRYGAVSKTLSQPFLRANLSPLGVW